MAACSRCGTANDDGRKFCLECGERLAMACGQCGTPNQAGAKFCGECGSPLTSGAPAAGTPVAGTPAPERATAVPREDTERKLVTVLFVDLVGSTTLAEQRDPEDVRSILGTYFDAAADAVRRHGGVVEKFIGDAVMAVWGTPIAHEDDAERAVRAALEIVDRVEGLGRSLGVELQARAGVLTGEAVATLGAVDQGLVAGDMVNTASRLQSAAKPGTVFVGERTQRATSQSIAYEPMGSLAVKGREEPVTAFQALRVIAEMRGAGRGNAPEPPFVGREEQLRLAKELLHATGREGRPRLIHVSGVAGIGKSRLVWELSKYIDGLTETLYWHSGRCPSYGEGVSFWALAEMVRARARIAESDDLDVARGKLTACLAQYVDDPEERRWIEPRLGYLLGLEAAPSGERDELFGAWRRFFEHVAQLGTVTLVVEDLQWADPGLMDFLESVLESSRTSPILVLSLARPELLDRRPGWSVGVRNSAVVHLDRLDDDEIREMVTGYVDGLPDDGMQRLVDRAEGVPMYAVETVRMLADRGVLEQSGERYVVAGELGAELDIPETLHALVAARLDGLPEAERALVQDAAVAGHSFTVPMVVAVSGRDTAEVEEVLRQLVRKEVLEQNTDPRSPERGQYGFVQSVIQEVAYSTLSKSSRRAKHLACARWIEQLGEDDLAGVVASHYLEAYRSDPSSADAEEIAAKARGALTGASDRALSLGSPDQALSFARQSLELASTPEERAPLHARSAVAATFSNQLDIAFEQMLAAVADYRTVGDVVAEARVLASPAGLGRYGADRRTRLDEVARDVLSRLRPDDMAERALVLSRLAGWHNARGEYVEALGLTDEAVTLAQQLDDDHLLLGVAGPRLSALNGAGRIWENEQLALGRLELARRVAGPAEVSDALLDLGMRVTDDNPREGFDLMMESARTAEAASLRPTQLLALGNACEIGVDVGEWEAVQAVLTDLLADESLTAEDRISLGLSSLMLRAQRGDPAGAVQSLKDIDLAEDGASERVQIRTWLLRVSGYLEFLRADPRAAVAETRTAIELEPSGLNSPWALWTLIQGAAVLHDDATIHEMLTLTSPLRGRWVRLVRRVGRLVEARLTEEPGEDVGGLLDAWMQEKLPLDHAYAVIALGHVVPGEELPADHVASARTYLLGLGAVALLRLLDEATA